MRGLFSIAGVLLAGAVLAGCGGDSGEAFDDPLLEVTIEAGEVQPRDQKAVLRSGVPIDVRITSDRPGELHFHARPDRTISFVPGTTTGQVRFDAPGVVRVEEHLSGIVVAQLKIR